MLNPHFVAGEHGLFGGHDNGLMQTDWLALLLSVGHRWVLLGGLFGGHESGDIPTIFQSDIDHFSGFEKWLQKTGNFTNKKSAILIQLKKH